MKHFLENIDPGKLKGLKIATIGLLIAITGFVFFIAGLNLIGQVILYSGFAIGFAGILVHVNVLFKTLRGRNK